MFCFFHVMSFISCSKKEPSIEDQGTLVFTANGEDFVRHGFLDKQGWRISFDKLFVNLVDPTAYGKPGEVILKGSFWVDLAEGDEHASPIVIGKIDNTNAGNYQSLKFKIERAASGEYKGHSIVMVGNAEKNGRKVPFIIRLDEEMDCDGKEGYVGDEVKGLLQAGAATDVEMTFHFDHVFGDREAPVNDHINTESVGFDFFNQFARDGSVEITQAEMAQAEGYDMLVKSIRTLGHLGEGHCDCTSLSSVNSI